MSNGLPSPTRFEQLRDLVFAKQTKVAWLPDLLIRQVAGDIVEVPLRGGWQRMTIDEAVEVWKRREMAIKRSVIDPFREGLEPQAWSDIDYLVCEMRVANPGLAIDILIMGGQGSGKSYFAGRCLNRCAVYNKMWLLWCFSTDEQNSVSVMQPAVYTYLPIEYRPENPGVKPKRNRYQKIIYTTHGGFTNNVVGYPNGSVLQFRYHSAELSTLEGPRPYFASVDENVTLPWIKGINDRLHSRAEPTRAYIEEFRAILEAKKANPSLLFPPAVVSRLYQGVQLITFTPKFGWTPTVGAFMDKATVVKQVKAELLPIKDAQGEFVDYEMVPRILKCADKRRAVFFMHPTDNLYAGNYQGFKDNASSMTRTEILWKVYGVASKMQDVRFPKFSMPTHVRSPKNLPQEGTWYCVVDPCPGRNFFIGYYKVNALGQIFMAREWPQEDDYIPGVGFPGPWAVSGAKMDGEKGSAQNNFGFGIQSYVDEMFRMEHALWLEENPNNFGEEGRIFIPEGNRIMDSRSGNTPTLEHESSETLIIKFSKLGLNFLPAGKQSGAKDGDTRVDESTELVNDLLFYDEDKITRAEDGSVTFQGKSPSLYISERCTNTIFSLFTWTGADGQKGSCKDCIDILRYLSMADPYYREPRNEDAQQFAGVY